MTERRYVVYQLVGAAGECLYIGSSFQPNLTKRLAQHRTTKGLDRSVTIEVIEEYPTYRDMCRGEVEWIRVMRPPGNVADWDTRPEVEPPVRPPRPSRKRPLSPAVQRAKEQEWARQWRLYRASHAEG